MPHLRHAVRSLGNSPGFTAVAVLSLALGIGANTAIFSLLNEVLLRALPVRNPHELVLFRAVHGAKGSMSRSSEGNGKRDPVTGQNSITSFSLLTFERFRALHPALSAVFAFAPIYNATVLVDNEAQLDASAQFVSGNYHHALGVPALMGRTLVAADDRPGAAPVAVISHRFWMSRLGGDRGVLGRTIEVNRVIVTIVGVTPPQFTGTQQVGENFDVSLPLALYALVQSDRPTKSQPWFWWVRIMGRLAPGATPAQARAGLEPLLQASASEGWRTLPPNTPATAEPRDPPTLEVESGAQGENDYRAGYRKSLRLLMGLAGLVLLAACANVGNLLLARGANRRREIAVRMALGASRARIVGQLLAEALLLGLAGAAAGLAVAFASRGLLLATLPFGGTATAIALPLDLRVLGFTTLVGVGTALLFGLAPAQRATRFDLVAEFQGGARTLASGRSRLSAALMVVQIAVSLVLLISTGLFMRTLRNLQEVDAGFDHRSLVHFRIDALAAGRPRETFDDLNQQIMARLERIPGVRGATFARVPLLARGRWTGGVSFPGRTLPPGVSTGVNVNAVAPNFFDLLGIPLVLGRAFTERDHASAPKVAVVNQAFAEKFLGGENPLGARFVFDRLDTEIVGVMRDTKYNDLRTAIAPTLFLPAGQSPGGSAAFFVRAAGDPAALFGGIRAAIRELDPRIPVAQLRTQEQQLALNHSQELLFARLSGFFGLLALGLACVGLYGLMSYSVVRRTGEIGLRLALGALPGHVLRMILRQALALIAVGVVVGVGAAIAAGRLIASMLFGVSPADPGTYVAVALVLGIVALAAALLPACRAAKIDPMVALRAG